MQAWKLAEIEKKTLLPGTQVRFVHGEHMTVAYWDFDPDVPLPEHAHPHEQVTNVIEGIFDLTVEGETTRLRPGSVVLIPPNATHSGKSITACRILDVFHPVREDYR
ncbi:MAG: cupin domain-containing protein [Anaerolineae bacterium]|jgi:quercetin dioxygenase-like cupin family protein